MLDYTLYGRGSRRAVAVYGLFGERSNFDAVFTGLDPDQWSIAVPDIRGYGASRDQSGPYDMQTIASDIIELADHLKWKTFTMIGHSMSGKVTLRTAIIAPERVERIIGLAPIWGGALKLAPEYLAYFESSAHQVEIREAIIANSVGKQLTSFWCGQRAALSYATNDPAAYLSYLRSFVSDDFEADAIKLEQDVLVITGERDVATTTMAKNHWQAKMRHVKVIVLPNCGHWLPLEIPLLVASAIDTSANPATV